MRARNLGRAREAARPFGMNVIEALETALIEDAHQIDHSVGALHRGADRAFMADIGGDGGDLAHVAHGLQEQGLVRAPDGDADHPAPPGQALYDIAADEA